MKISTLQVDYGVMADDLFQIGCEEEVRGPARRQIYELVRIFRVIAAGEELPDEMEALAESQNQGALGLTAKDIQAAVDRLEQREAAYRRRNKKNKVREMKKDGGVVKSKNKRRKKKKAKMDTAVSEPSTSAPAVAPDEKKSSKILPAVAPNKKKSSKTSPVVTPDREKSSKTSPVVTSDKEKSSKTSPVVTSDKEKSSKTSPRTNSSLPHRRVSFGKIYRKPFKKKDIVCTPSRASEPPGRSILKAAAISLTMNSIGSRRQRRKTAIVRSRKS